MDLRCLQILMGAINGLEVKSLWRQSPRDGKEEDMGESVPDDPEETPLLQYLRVESNELLARAISELPEKERQVLELYYYKSMTMKQVGVALGVGESRVSQIHSMAVVRMRARLSELSNAGRNTERSSKAASGA